MDPGKKEYSGEVFTGLDLKKKALTSKHFTDCLFKSCDLTAAVIRLCVFKDCRFESCNLSLAALHGSVFSGVTFKDSKLVGVNWTEAAWPRIQLASPVQFEGCLLNDSVFLGLKLGGTRITRCLAKGADFRDADLSKADLTHTDFSGALFGQTDLTGANLDQARNYAIRISDNKVKGASFSMPEAMALLYCLDIKII
jgi:uncharacterized protein YjbI with pentapeptide repeats